MRPDLRHDLIKIPMAGQVLRLRRILLLFCRRRNWKLKGLLNSQLWLLFFQISQVLRGLWGCPHMHCIMVATYTVIFDPSAQTAEFGHLRLDLLLVGEGLSLLGFPSLHDSLFGCMELHVTRRFEIPKFYLNRSSPT